MSSPMPVPCTSDPDSAQFWAFAAEGRLMVSVGADGKPIHPPRQSGVGTPARWVAASGEGFLHTWTLVEHAIDPAFPAPYAIVLVELADYPQVRLIGHLPGTPTLHANMRMQVKFENRNGVMLPQWEVLPDMHVSSE